MEDTMDTGGISNEAPEGERRVRALNPPGAFMAFLGMAGLGYLGMLAFVFAFGLYGESLTSGIDLACAEAAFQSGKQVEEKGNYDLAIQRYRQALQGHFADKNREYECARSIGEVMVRLGRFEEAVDAYKALSPDAFTLPGHLTGYVTALFRSDQLDEAARVGGDWLAKAQAANDQKQMVWAHTTLGQVAEKLNRPDEAMNHYRAAFALDPENESGLLAARLLERQGKRDEAIAQAEAVLAAVKTGPVRDDAQRFHDELTAPAASQ